MLHDIAAILVFSLLLIPLFLLRASALFQENLSFYAVRGGLTAAHFEFSQESGGFGRLDLTHFDFGTFPRPIVELVHDFGLERLRVSFLRGRWDYNLWGRPLISPASMGIEVEATFAEAHDQGDVLDRWNRLTNLLSGVFCGSINLIKEMNTLLPLSPHDARDQALMTIRGQLPGEAVCTENLTPWTKLLPCSSHAGLSMLLNPFKIFDTPFHQFDVNVSLVPSTTSKHLQQIRVGQNLVVVFNRPRRDLPMDWTLSELLGKVVRQPCQACSDSTIRFFPDISQVQVYALRDGIEQPVEDRTISTSDYLGQDLGIRGLQASLSSLSSDEIKVLRNLAGIGQEAGTWILRIINSSSRAILVRYLEAIPPFIRAFLSQTRFSKNGQIIGAESVVQRTIFSPSIFRAMPAQLEMDILVPGESTITMELPFEKEFLRYTDYPFDPNRGFDLAGATIEYTSSTGHVHRIVTQKLLVTMPTPDFTMPYNVITLTSTLIVLFYGTFFNLSFRRFYTGPALLARIKDKLKRLVLRPATPKVAKAA